MYLHNNKTVEYDVEKNYPVFYDTKDIMKIFKIGKNKAYDLMKVKGFPSFRIDNRLLVEKSELEKWIARQKFKTINT